ncbi:MAG: hypothetical protein ACR2LL_09885 [Nitrosopumilus sp.]
MVDGRDNQLFARYLASKYKGTSDKKPLEIDSIVVIHGDADHFIGLNKIKESENNPTHRKRRFIHSKRIYHNGLTKGPSNWM